MEIEEPSGLEQTVVNLQGRQILITIADARKIQQALEEYLRNNREKLAQVIPSNLLDDPTLVPGEAWISQDGMVRMGFWRLDVMRDQLVLFSDSRRGAHGGHRYVATVEHPEEGLWRIPEIKFQRLFY